jgi:hypothetical protein
MSGSRQVRRVALAGTFACASLMPYEVAVTAWARLVGCDVFGEDVLDVVRDFRDEFRGNGPEPIPIEGA